MIILICMILLTTQHIILLLSNLKCLILQYKIRYTQNNMRHYKKKKKPKSAELFTMYCEEKHHGFRECIDYFVFHCA
jgi:hypothetical protein